MAPINKVVIIGAGPSGLILGIELAQAGIEVELLDAGKELDKNPRASHYSAPACVELDRAGVLDTVREQGFFPDGVSWRLLDGSRLTGISNKDIGENSRLQMVCLPLDRLGKILMDKISKEPKATVRWSHKVTGIGQDDSKAWVDVETPEGNQKVTADYIVGCDGANSQIRRSLFGDWNFPGWTWDKQIVATNVSRLVLLRQMVLDLADLTTRCTTTSSSTDTMTPTSSYIQITTIW